MCNMKFGGLWNTHSITVSVPCRLWQTYWVSHATVAKATTNWENGNNCLQYSCSHSELHANPRIPTHTTFDVSSKSNWIHLNPMWPWTNTFAIPNGLSIPNGHYKKRKSNEKVISAFGSSIESDMQLQSPLAFSVVKAFLVLADLLKHTGLQSH